MWTADIESEAVPTRVGGVNGHENYSMIAKKSYIESYWWTNHHIVVIGKNQALYTENSTRFGRRNSTYFIKRKSRRVIKVAHLMNRHVGVSAFRPPLPLNPSMIFGLELSRLQCFILRTATSPHLSPVFVASPSSHDTGYGRSKQRIAAGYQFYGKTYWGTIPVRKVQCQP